MPGHTPAPWPSFAEVHGPDRDDMATMSAEDYDQAARCVNALAEVRNPEGIAGVLRLARARAAARCTCDEPEPGESGVIICDACEWRTALRGAGVRS